MNERSCVGCVFMYFQDHGYSNWTVDETTVHCAQDMNPELKGGPDRPYDWLTPQGEDRWPATMHRRCELYANIDAQAHLDVDGQDSIDDMIPHPFFASIIKQHSERT